MKNRNVFLVHTSRDEYEGVHLYNVDVPVWLASQMNKWRQIVQYSGTHRQSSAKRPLLLKKLILVKTNNIFDFVQNLQYKTANANAADQLSNWSRAGLRNCKYDCASPFLGSPIFIEIKFFWFRAGFQSLWKSIFRLSCILKHWNCTCKTLSRFPVI